MKICCLNEDIKEFPDKDFTEIGERGINISGGYWNKINFNLMLK